MKRALIFLALMAAACATGDVRARFDADADLAAFDRDNPGCELWTNWKTMCSRTGKDGETFCKQDPAMPVTPSAAFCVVDRNQAFNPIETYSTPQHASYMRFCEKRSSETWAHLRDSAGMVASCVSYLRERPFNGYHLEARRHPWCTSWTTWSPENELLLQEDANNPNRGTLDCSKTSCSKLAFESELSCRTKNVPHWCSGVSWMNLWGALPGQTTERPSDPDRVDMLTAYGYLRADLPVVGVYCLPFTNKLHDRDGIKATPPAAPR